MKCIQEVWVQCTKIFDNGDFAELSKCLSCLKILSRDETFRKYLAEESNLLKLIAFSFPYIYSKNLLDESRLDGLKILSNIIFKEPYTIDFLKYNAFFVLFNFRSQDILKKLTDYINLCITNEFSESVLLLHLKVLFILSGLSDSVR